MRLPRRGGGGGALTRFERRVHSQNGEDGVIAEILRRIGEGSRGFAEFGAGHGEENCCRALAEAGWHGLYIEGDPDVHAQLAARWAARDDVETLCAVVGEDSIDGLLAGRDVDVLVVDLDGRDWWVWRAITSVRPRLVVCEYNAALGFEAALTVPRDHAEPWDGTDFFGASLPALELLAGAKGYRLVHTDSTGVNAFFARADLDRGLPAPDAVPRHPPNLLGRGLTLPPDPQGRAYAPVTADLLPIGP